LGDRAMKPPAFQFYPADFLSDENVVLMTNQEIGCYIKLICFCWKQGSIPTAMKKIAQLCGENELTMTELWDNISPCFKSKGNGRLYHPRLARERAKQDSWRKRCIAGGKKSAEAKAVKARQQREEARVVQPENKFYLKGRSTLQSSSSSISSSIKKKKKEIYKEKRPDHIPFKEIIEYLNSKSKKNFLHTSKETRRAIRARWKSGFTLENFFSVIDKKCDKWLCDEQMVDYLRPITLFGTKFESYLNETEAKEGNEEWRISNKSNEWLSKHNIVN